MVDNRDWSQRVRDAAIAFSTQQPSGSLHPILIWLRAVGALGVLLGVCAMIFTTLFWVATIIFYLAILLSVIDVLLEPSLKGHPIWRGIIIAPILFFAGIFSWKVIFVPAPLAISAFVEDQDAVVGSLPANWNPAWLKATVTLANNSDLDYEHLNILIKPEQAITLIQQTTDLSGVDFQEASQIVTSAFIAIPNSGPLKGRRINLELHLVASSVGYYVHCALLPAHTHLNIMLALAAIRPPSKASDSHPGDLHWYNVFNFNDGTHTWYARDNADIFVSPGRAKSLTYRGTYMAALRQRSLEGAAQFAGYFSINAKGVPSLK